ncbi:Ig-like domain-containing protein, partial [Sediminibacterium ginsengisoli]
TKTYGTLHTFANSTSEVTVTGVSTPIFAPNNAISALALTSTGTPANAAASATPYPIVITNNSVVIKDANGTGADVTANYDITLVDGGLTINKATLTFTANNATKVYGDTYTFATDGTATTMTGSLVNGNTISVNPVVTASNSGATAGAPVSGTYATQITTNSVTIIDPANSNADVTSNYDITLVPGTFTITKRQITVTAKDVTKTYGTLHTFANTASEVTVTGVSSPALAATNAISGITLTSTGAPANAAASVTPYPIVITNNSVVIKDANGTGADVTANYDITLVDGGLTINKAALTFTANNATKVYGDTYTFATDGTATTMTGSLVNGNTISVNPVVTASNSGATAAAPVSGTYATQITANSVTIIDPVNSNADVTSNYNITLVPGTFTITKRQITVTAKDVTKTYGTLHTFANSTSEVTVTGVSTPIFAPNNAISALALTSTGTPANAAASATPYPIIVTNNSVVIKDANGTGADVTANYDITLVNGGLTINKAAITFKANDVTKTYGDAYTFPTDGTATAITSGGLVNSNTIGTNPVVTSTGAPAAAVVGGSPYTTVITPGSLVILDPANSNADVTSNYDITLVDGALTINKRAVTFRANDVSKAYGTVKTFATDGTAVSVTAGSIAAADLLKAATVTSTTGSPAMATVAGNTYSIDITNGTIRIENASNVDVTSSYDITLASGALTVTKVPLTIKAADKSKVYDAQVFGGGYSILSYTGFVNGENENTPGVLGGTLAYSGTSQTAVNAGTYPITPGGLTAGNYTITFEDGTLTISKRPISITAYSTTKKYNHTITLASNVTVTAGTLVPGDAISASVLTSTGTPQAAALGTYPIVITPGTPVIKTTPGADVTSNYDITYVDGTLTVIPNVNPVANNDSKVTSANIPVTINVPGNDTDADGVIDPTTVTIITQPAHGIVTIDPVTGEVKYTPNPGYYGTDVFTYTIKDDDGGVSNVATVNITVLLGPAAQNDAASTNPATPVTLDILGNDVVGDAALNPGTTTVVTQPAHGTVTIDPATGKATYTPNPGFYGDDSFTYTVKDANGVISNVATATIHVYKPPVATNDAAVTNPSTPVVIDILANDVKGDGNLVPNTVTIISQPAHGVLSVDPATGKVTYTPNNGYYGPDVFTYTVKDQYGNVTNVATVNITVNQPPVANNDVAATIPDTPVTIDILGNDAIGSAALVPSTVTIVTQPAHGTLSIDPATGKVKYTPNPGYYGPDNFTYTVKDANGAISNVATVTINISQGPTAVNDAAMTPPNTPVTINILGNDLQGAAALAPGTVSIVAQTAHGTLSVNPTTGRVTYTPNPGYYGPDVFTYTVKDANGAISNVATVNITVPKPPTAVNDNVVANPGVPVTIDILANDVKGDGNLVPSTVTVVTPPAHGTFTIDPATGKVVYTPNPGYFGPDSFTYTVVDANGAISNVATVNIYVNKPPTATNDAAKTRMNVPVTLDILANDVKGDGNLVPSTVTIVTQPAHGTLSIDPATGKVVYTPANGYYGTDSFTYTVKDANGNISNVATASITINRPPLATNDAATTETDVPVTINLIANDAAYGTTLNPASIVVVAQPAHGTVTIRPDGTVIYTPAPGYEGTDVFTYTILDNNGEISNVATVNLTILTVKPDLYVTKRLVTVAPNVKVGKEVEYEIEVTNLSRATANNVVITDPLPGNLGGANVTTTVQKGTASYDKTTKTITWKIPTLAFNEKSTMRLKVQVTSGGDIVNTVSVKSDEVDGNPANNLASATYSVSADTTVKDDIFIPNVVTPNGDGKNDKFLILGINRYPGTQLVIYNRWGNMVFHSKDYSNNWDGSGLNEGTYFYILTVPKPTGTKVYNGWVQLIR